MNRNDEIRQNLAACEEVHTLDRMQGWEKHCITVYRRNFDRQGDLNDNEYETLERIRNRRNPPKLGPAGQPVGGANKAQGPSYPTASTGGGIGGLTDIDACAGTAASVASSFGYPFDDLIQEMQQAPHGVMSIPVNGTQMIISWDTGSAVVPSYQERMAKYEQEKAAEQKNALHGTWDRVWFEESSPFANQSCNRHAGQIGESLARQSALFQLLGKDVTADERIRQHAVGELVSRGKTEKGRN